MKSKYIFRGKKNEYVFQLSTTKTWEPQGNLSHVKISQFM